MLSLRSRQPKSRGERGAQAAKGAGTNGRRQLRKLRHLQNGSTSAISRHASSRGGFGLLTCARIHAKQWLCRRKSGKLSLFTQVEGLDWNLAMPRPLRIQYEGAIYHLMSRRDRREAIFSLNEISSPTAPMQPIRLPPQQSLPVRSTIPGFEVRTASFALCSLLGWKYSRSGGRRPSGRGTDAATRVASRNHGACCVRGASRNLSSSNSVGDRPTDRSALCRQTALEGRFSPRRESLRQSNGAESSRFCGWAIRN